MSPVNNLRFDNKISDDKILKQVKNKSEPIMNHSETLASPLVKE